MNVMLGSRATALAKISIVGTFFVLGTFLVMRIVRFPIAVDFGGWRALRLLAIPPMLVGALVGLRCVFDFAWTGLGTPAPIDPPRHLVVVGFYRYVRNPMYVGYAAMLLFGWVAFLPFVWLGVMAATVVLGGVHLFVRLYEEPTLRRLFGAEYEEYCANVPRWLPRLTPWRAAV
jgi:protein-S-isoprenylcysteine O-methyltransferase Ste14